VEELRKIYKWSVLSRRYSNQQPAEHETTVNATSVHKKAVVSTVHEIERQMRDARHI